MISGVVLTMLNDDFGLIIFLDGVSCNEVFFSFVPGHAIPARGASGILFLLAVPERSQAVDIRQGEHILRASADQPETDQGLRLAPGWCQGDNDRAQAYALGCNA